MKRTSPPSSPAGNITKEKKIKVGEYNNLDIIMTCLVEIVKYMTFQDLFKFMMVSRRCSEECKQESVLRVVFCSKYGKSIYDGYVERGITSIAEIFKSLIVQSKEEKSLSLEEIEKNPLIILKKRKQVGIFAKIGNIRSPFDIYLRTNELNDIQSIISRIWQPLESPAIIELLQERVKDLYIVYTKGSWVLLYVVQVEDKVELWRGNLCNMHTADIQVKRDFQIDDWKIPPSLSKFYCVHDGFSRTIDESLLNSFNYNSICSSAELKGFAIGPEKSYLLLKIFFDSCGQGAAYCHCLDPNIALPPDQVFDHYGQLPINSDFEPFIYYLEGYLEKINEDYD